VTRWLLLGALYAGFLFWYGGWGAPLSADEMQQLAARMEAVVPSPEARAVLTEFARTDDGREFFMVNLNRYRAEPSYADGRPTGGASAQEVEARYVDRMLPRLLLRACHPWVATVPIVALAGTPEPWALDRITVVRYRSRRDFLDIVVTADWAEDAEHKWAALESAHSYATRPFLALPGPRAIVLALLLVVGLLLRSARRRAPRASVRSRLERRPGG
jgi:hypothetical protein